MTAVDGRFQPCSADTDRAAWHPDVAKFFEYWLRIAPAGRLPGRQHLDPLDIPTLIPHLWLLDVVEGDFRFRLAGTEVVRLMEREVTGLPIGQVNFGSVAVDALRRRLQWMVDNRTATHRRGSENLLAGRGHSTLENCMVPLARDGETVDMIAGYNRLFRSTGADA